MSARYCYAPLPAGTRAKALPSGIVAGEPNAVPVLLTAGRSRHTLHDVRLFVVLDHDDGWPDARAADVVRTTLAAGGAAGISFGDLGDALACSRLAQAEAARLTATDLVFRTALDGARNVLVGMIRSAGTSWPGEVAEPAVRSAEALIRYHLAVVMGDAWLVNTLAGGLAEFALMEATAIVAGERGE